MKLWGHCFRQCWATCAPDLVKHGWDFPLLLLNFNKIRLSFYLIKVYHKYRRHSKNTLLYYNCKSSSGKTIAKYKNGSADSQIVKRLWHVMCFHKEPFQKSMTSCSCFPLTRNWPIKLRQKKIWFYFFFYFTAQWCKESICFICASYILHAFYVFFYCLWNYSHY